MLVVHVTVGTVAVLGVNPWPCLARYMAHAEASVNKWSYSESLVWPQHRETPGEIEERKVGLCSEVASVHSG